MITCSPDGLPFTKDLVKKYRLYTNAKLGQHFLFDMQLTERIVKTASSLNTGTIIEIGPGPGQLTRSLLLNGAKNLVVIEKDKRFKPILDQIKKHYSPFIHIIYGNALDFDLTLLGPPPLKVIANLPYNIGTHLLLNWLEYINKFDSLTLMLQKEVAYRIVSKIDSKSYGRLSVLCQYLCDTKILFDIPNTAFFPPPKVHSSIVYFKPKYNLIDDNIIYSLKKITQATFSQRRKMLRNSLKSLNIDVNELTKRADIIDTLRPESISVNNFIKMVYIYNKMRHKK